MQMRVNATKRSPSMDIDGRTLVYTNVSAEDLGSTKRRRNLFRPNAPKTIKSDAALPPRSPKRSIPTPTYRQIRSKRSIFDNLGSILGSIFDAFRGNIARATRLAARRAEPLFLLACAVLQRVCRLCEKNGNQRNSVKNRSKDALQTGRAKKNTIFSLPGAT